MNSKLNRSIPLLPLRLEIRWIKDSVRLAKHYYPDATDESDLVHDGKVLKSRLSYHTMENVTEQIWIRWYPDALAIDNQPKEITKAEEIAFQGLVATYSTQADVSAELPDLIQSFQAFVSAVYPVGESGESAEKAIRLLYGYNGLWPIELTAEEREHCQHYNEASLAILLDHHNRAGRSNGTPAKVGIRLGWGLYDLENPVLAEAWRVFASKVGPVRARYIATARLSTEIPGQSVSTTSGVSGQVFRENANETLTRILDEGIPIALMPPAVQLYTVKNNQIEALGSAVDVPDHKSLKTSISAQNEAKWIEDFNAALQAGMGTVIKDPASVEKIRTADWLIALGVDETQRDAQAFESVLKGLRSRGELGLLAQGTPTNNTEGSSTTVAGYQTDFAAYLKSSLMSVPGGAATGSGNDMGYLERDAKRLADALGIDPGVLSETPASDLEQQVAARAANELVWLLCAGPKTLWYDILDLVDDDPLWDQIGELFRDHVRAGGHLPAFRAGSKPFAVLPVTLSESWKPRPNGDTQRFEFQKKVATLVEFLRVEFRELARHTPAIGRVEQAQAYNTLLDVLRRTAVSRCLNVRPTLASELDHSLDPRYLMMSLVADQPAPDEQHFDPLKYLKDFASTSITENSTIASIPLANPDGYYAGDVDADHPLGNSTRIRVSLLHWLLALQVKSLDDEPDSPWQPQVIALQEIVKPLCRCSVDQLELLFMGALDLLSHRLDAWMTALAAIRLAECNPEGLAGWPYGVYGWLEKPGTGAVGAKSCRFLQAPSRAQAVASALLANSSLHSGQADENPLHFNMDSARVRLGLWILAGLRAGRDHGELLGVAAERMISNLAGPTAGLSHRDIYVLRDAYRLASQSIPGGETDIQQTTVPTVMDGSGFLEDPERTEKFDNRYEALAEAVDNIRDAANDVAVAEMLYAFIQGNTSATSAWMDYFDGDALPPEPHFSSSRRTGTTITTQFLLNVDVSSFSEPETFDVTAVADPVLQQLSVKLLPEFEQENVRVRVRRSMPDAPAFNHVLTLEGDLGLCAADCVVLDHDGLLSRIRDVLISRWRHQEGLPQQALDALKEYPRLSRTADVRSELEVKLLDAASNEVDSIVSFPAGLAARAVMVRTMLQRTQAGTGPQIFDPVSGVRLSAFTAEGSHCDTNWSSTCDALKLRAARLSDWITELLSDDAELKSCLGTQHAVGLLSGRTDTGISAKLAKFNVPMSLTVLPRPKFDTGEGKAGLIEIATGKVRQIIEHLQQRVSRANELLLKAETNTRIEDKLLHTAQAIRTLAGRPGLPIMTPLIAASSGRYSANLGSRIGINDEMLTVYAKVRPAVADILDLLDGSNDYVMYRTVQENSIDIVLSSTNQVTNQKRLCLVLLDKYTEFVPSIEETTAISVQYDAPAARAPNVILLAVPPVYSDADKWTEDMLADILRSTLDWMQIRTVSAQDVIGDNVLGHYLPLMAGRGGKSAPVPTASKPLQELMYDRSYDYQLADEMDETERQPPDLIAERRSKRNRA